MAKKGLVGNQKCAIFLPRGRLVVKKEQNYVHVVFECSPMLIKVQSRGRSEYVFLNNFDHILNYSFVSVIILLITYHDRVCNCYILLTCTIAGYNL